jgi:hypothetical protein
MRIKKVHFISSLNMRAIELILAGRQLSEIKVNVSPLGTIARVCMYHSFQSYESREGSLLIMTMLPPPLP